MKAFPLRSRSRQKAFTLVEVLVACAVMALLVVMVAQMVGSASSVTGASKKRLDADDEARLVFDRMAGDIALMLKRPDINPLFMTNAAGDNNDEFYFYSQSPAYSTNTNSSNNSEIALIGYRIDATNGLQRLGMEESWDDLSFSTNVSTNTATETNYHTIAPSVFRLEFALLMKPGSTNSTNGTNGIPFGPWALNGTTIYTNGTNVFFQTNNAGQALKDVSGIVVALAILDPTSQKIISTNALQELALGMNDAVTNTILAGQLINGVPGAGIPSDSWKTNALHYSGTGPATIPKAALSQIRIYQRYFPINQ